MSKQLNQQQSKNQGVEEYTMEESESPNTRKSYHENNFEEEEGDCQAIPFIRFVQADGKFELDPEAEAFLKGLGDTKLGVVAVCGKYRTGKSYLLNKLFVETYFQKKRAEEEKKTGAIKPLQSGFQVSPTINACTKGLWLWKRVIKTESPNGTGEVSMIVVDTEGLGAYDEDENHDAKIFLLAMLLSSLLIYNSVGTIDENALNSLSLVINLSKKIQLKASNNENSGDSQEDLDILAKMFPSFLWVLRDFALKLVDNEGNKMTPKQYLESALREQKGCSEAVESKNRLRRLLAHFFQERDCCTLVRPTEQEKDLQALVRLPNSDLREEFVDQMNKLKAKVMGKVKVKQIQGHALNGSMLVELANSYIKALNDGHVPVIENAWTNVCHFEQERCFKEAQALFMSQISTRVKLNKSPTFDIKSTLKSIREQAFTVLKRDFLGELKSLEHYRSRLASDFKTHSKSAISDFNHRVEETLKDLLSRRISEDLESRVRRGDAGLRDGESLMTEVDRLLVQVQAEQPDSSDGRQVENVYRKLIQQRLPKLLEQVHSFHCQVPQHQTFKTQEHQLKLAKEDSQKYKEERQEVQRESYEKANVVERERSELVRREKVLEIKLREAEERLRETQRQLKWVVGRETTSYGTQTEKVEGVLCFERQVQATPGMRERDVQVMIKVQTSNAQVETDIEEIPDNYIAAVSINTETVRELSPMSKKKSSSSTNTPQYMEQNLRLLQDILTSLKSNTNPSIDHQLSEVIRSNQIFSLALEQSERRCSQLEKKLDRKTKCEQLVKNCQRLECNQCNKLYTPTLFVQHFQVCCKRRSNNAIITRDDQRRSELTNEYMSQRSMSVASLDQNNNNHVVVAGQEDVQNPPPFYTDNNNSQDDYHNSSSQQHQQYEGGEASITSYNENNSYEQQFVEDDSNNNRRLAEFLQRHQNLMTESGETFLAKIINVQQVCHEDYMSPYFKQSQEDQADNTFVNSSSNIELHFCVFNQSTVSYLQRTLQQVKNAMNRIQRRVKSPSEQCQIAKWIMEIDRNEQDFQRIAEIIELFFATIHRKIIENSLQLNKHVIIEDINGLDEPYHLYVNEFVEFFEIQDYQGLINIGSSLTNNQIRPFTTNNNNIIADSLEENQPKTHQQYQTKRYTLGGDDEVILQTPFENEEEGSLIGAQNNVEGGRGSSCIVVIQEDDDLSSQNLENNRHHHKEDSQDTAHLIANCRQQPSNMNTLKLNNCLETSLMMDENSALHMVSFFSKDDNQLSPPNNHEKQQVDSSVEFDQFKQQFSHTYHHPMQQQQIMYNMQPFSNIQNNINHNQDQMLGFQVLKKSYQSPLGMGKKSAIDKRRQPLLIGMTTAQQHQNYFNHGQYQQQQQHNQGGLRRSRSQFKEATVPVSLINFYNDQ